MTDTSPKVVSCHWFGGSDKLPSNTRYIGRPSPFGNPYSSKTGQYTREECIALHRVDLYRSLTANPAGIGYLRQELGGCDLACWCKQPKRIVGCHGDNFLHVLSPAYAERTYTKSTINYLMEDLRVILGSLRHWILHTAPADDFMWLELHFNEVKMEIERALSWCKEKDAPVHLIEFLVAQLVIDLELAGQETVRPFIEYRLSHASWVVQRFCTGNPDRSREPSPPDIPLKRKKKE
jgi:hypothetical protein